MIILAKVAVRLIRCFVGIDGSSLKNGTTRTAAGSWLSRQLEVVALRHQLSVYERPVHVRDRRRVASLGIEEVPSAPRSPWKNPYVERLIGTSQRECFDHAIVSNASHARRILACYLCSSSSTSKPDRRCNAAVRAMMNRLNDAYAILDRDFD